MRYKWLTVALVLCTVLPATVSGTVIQVAAGENAIDDALFGAVAGDTLMLTTSGGVYNEAFTTVIDIPVTIMAADTLADRPVWTCNNPDQQITVNANLALDGIIFEGSANDSLTTDCIRTGDTEGLELRVNNCLFRNYFDGVGDGHAIKGKQEARLDTLIVTNCRFEHMPGEHISYKDGVADSANVPIKYSRIEYCTFWDGDNEAIYIEDNDSDASTAPHPVIIINHVTCYDMGPKPIYPKETDGAVVRNSIVVKTGGLAVTIYESSVLENFLYYEAPDGIDAKDNSTYDPGKVLANQNPYFKDAANGDFAIAANSPAALFADDGGVLGDTTNGTWDAAEISCWEIVENNDWGRLIKGATTDGDTIMFVTSGGEYYTPGSISTQEQTLTFMAEPGLAAKPVLSTFYWNSSILKIHGPSTVKGLVFQGNGMLTHPDSVGSPMATDGPTAYLLYWEDEGQHYGNVVIEDCDFITARLRAIHTDDNNTTDTLIVNNCYFEEIGETGIYGKQAVRNIDVAIITNNTFYKIGSTPLRLTNVGDMQFTNNTIAVLDSSLTGRSTRGIYAENDTVVVIRDNIFAYIQEVGVRVYGPSPTVEYNLFHECGLNIINEDDTLMTFPTFNIEGDPIFKDTSAASLDLALEVNGDAIEAASDGGNLGDPRWGTWTYTSVDDDGMTPVTYALHQNYPNPFNPSTTIRFDVAAAGHVSLKVYDLLGREVALLLNREVGPGNHSVTWNAEGLTSGIYFYRIQVNDFVKNRKLVLLK